jgi:hypothetical protein
MRSADKRQDWMFSRISAENRAPTDHQLRPTGTVVDTVLKDLSFLFESLYADVGRPPVAPEKLLRTLLGNDLGSNSNLQQPDRRRLVMPDSGKSLDFTQVDVCKCRPSNSCFAEINTPQIRVVQSRTAKIRAAQDRAAQIRAAQVRAAQVCDAQVPAD